MADTEPTLTVTLPLPVTTRRIADLIVGAFEGGSGYWLNGARLLHGEAVARPWYSCAAFYALPDWRMRLTFDNPHEGPDTATADVGPAELVAGLASMAEKSPAHFADWLADNDDAATSDVFIQYVIFGEVIYG